MNRYYFTYGTDEKYPYRGGWTVVVAETVEIAKKIFSLYHPPRYGNVGNYCDCYTECVFEKTEMCKKGNFGKFCVEVLGCYRIEI